MTNRIALFAALAALLACGSAAEEGAETTTGAALAARIEAGSAPVILDVRTPEEFAAGHLQGAVNVPHDQLAARLAGLGLDPSAEVVVHCERGGRAKAAEAVLHQAGFTRVVDLEGHMKGWRAAGLPTETESVPEKP
ncbi:MAG: rhodanese-like domain-containing protein [Myxococcales bacterium]|nr:rhodanese-like domain-containing protein [Myxococcales bacterium]